MSGNFSIYNDQNLTNLSVLRSLVIPYRENIMVNSEGVFFNKGSIIYNEFDNNLYFGNGTTLLKVVKEDGTGKVTITELTVETDLTVKGESLFEETATFCNGIVVKDTATSPVDPTGTTTGVVWTQTGSPNTLFFTDNTGIDHDLLAGGGGGSVTSVGFKIPGIESGTSGLSFSTDPNPITGVGEISLAQGNNIGDLMVWNGAIWNKSRLTAGLNVTIDDTSVPGEISISAVGGGGGSAGIVQVSSNELLSNTVDYTTVCVIPWLNALYAGFTMAQFIYQLDQTGVSADNRLNFRVRAVGAATNIIDDLLVGTAGMLTSEVSSSFNPSTTPGVNDRLEIQFLNNKTGTGNPTIYGIMLSLS